MTNEEILSIFKKNLKEVDKDDVNKLREIAARVSRFAWFEKRGFAEIIALVRTLDELSMEGSDEEEIQE